MNTFSCQLYKYDEDFFLLKGETPSYFANNFHENELDGDFVSWLNFHGILPYQDEIEHLCDNLGIDKLTVEDIYTQKKRSKLEEYPNYIFFSVRSVLPSLSEDQLLQKEQISFVLGKDYLISFQEKKSDHFTEVRDRIQKKRGKIRFMKSDFLMFRMLDAIVDNYFEVLEDIASKNEKLEHKLTKHPNKDNFKQIEYQKRLLIELRKVVLPMRDVTLQLEVNDHPLLAGTTLRYFGDLQSNCVSILEDIDSQKLILDGLTNLYYAGQSQRMNDIMKVLTVISAIFIPLTFIVGVYGMNFENMPELKTKYGYFVALAVMTTLALGMFFIFWKRGWLKREL
ncbi:MAG: magnesium/cobalt transporter CorA [Bacteroidota bacterium]